MENALIGIAIVLIVILVCREITCWYFKINATLEVLEEIRDLLKGRGGPGAKEISARPVS